MLLELRYFGRREALLFALEEESNTHRFSIGRLAHYCLDLAELYETDRVVRKYIDFVDIYTNLTDNERQQYERDYKEESDEMAGFAERFTTIGLERGLEQGREEGRRLEAVSMLTLFLSKRFGPLDSVTRQRLEEAPIEHLEAWSARVLDVESLEEVFE